MKKLLQGIQYKLKQWRSRTDTERECTITEIECENKELLLKLLERFNKEARNQIIED